MGKHRLATTTYPTILILVSKTETVMSWSKVTWLMTSLMAFSNSSRSPKMTKVSRESISVREKLRKQIHD